MGVDRKEHDTIGWNVSPVGCRRPASAAAPRCHRPVAGRSDRSFLRSPAESRKLRSYAHSSAPLVIYSTHFTPAPPYKSRAPGQHQSHSPRTPDRPETAMKSAAAVVLLLCASQVSWAQFSASQLGSSVTYSPLNTVQQSLPTITTGGVSSGGLFRGTGVSLLSAGRSGVQLGSPVVGGFNSVSYSPLPVGRQNFPVIAGLGSVRQLGVSSLGSNVRQLGFNGVPLTGRRVFSPHHSDSAGSPEELQQLPHHQSRHHLRIQQSGNEQTAPSRRTEVQYRLQRIPGSRFQQPRFLSLGRLSSRRPAHQQPDLRQPVQHGRPQLGRPRRELRADPRLPPTLSALPTQGFSSVSYSPLTVPGAQRSVVGLSPGAAVGTASLGSVGLTRAALGGLANSGFNSVSYTPLSSQTSTSRQRP